MTRVQRWERHAEAPISANVHGAWSPFAGDIAVTNALGERFGDALDLMSLDRAGSVARYAALGGGEVLVELTQAKFANSQMAAWGEYVDTHRLRDAALEAMAG